MTTNPNVFYEGLYNIVRFTDGRYGVMKAKHKYHLLGITLIVPTFTKRYVDLDYILGYFSSVIKLRSSRCSYFDDCCVDSLDEARKAKDIIESNRGHSTSRVSEIVE